MAIYSLNTKAKTEYELICEDMSKSFEDIKMPKTIDEIAAYQKRIQTQFKNEIQYAKDHKGIVNEDVT